MNDEVVHPAKRLLSAQRGMVILLLAIACGLTTFAQSSDRVVTKDDVTTRVVLRESATAQSADKGTLRPGDSAELLGSVPNWYEVRLPNGTEGFVSKRWTRVGSAAAPPLAPAAATSFTIDVVDVGTGLGVLVRGADFTLVYDGGSNDDVAHGGANRMLAFIWAAAPSLTTIQHVILSHPHQDHVELLPDLFPVYRVREVWDAGVLNDICVYRAFVRAVRDEPGVQYHVASQDGGTRDYTFNGQTCGGTNPETIRINLGSRIEQAPIALGQGASMTFLHADGNHHSSFNENSLVVRLDLGDTRVLLMGDSEAGGRKPPTAAPSPSSIEGALLACCQQALAAEVLIAGHHGSLTSSRKAFLDAVMASTYLVSGGPHKYSGVTLPDKPILDELKLRGKVLQTDLNDATCGANAAKIGPDADGQPGGCDNIRLVIPMTGPIQANYFRGAD